MQSNHFGTTQAAGSRAAFDQGLRTHMQSVYNRMAMGLVVTALVAFFVSQSEPLLQLIFATPLKWVVMLAPVGLVWFGFKPDRMPSNQLKIVFFAISALYGVSLSVIFLAFSGESIARAFFMTAAMFAGLSLFGYTTKKDLGPIGSFCVMGVIGVLLMGLFGIFFGYSTGMRAVVDIVAILAFSGLTAWETQATKEQYNASYGGEVNSRMAWSAALSLYINFVAIFVHLLSFLNRN